MGVSVVFEGSSDPVRVVPGEEAVTTVRLENTGMVVDRIVLDVLGDASGWAQVEPAQVNLLPGATERVRVRFKPPRAATLEPGEVPFGLRAMSTEDPEGSSIEESVVWVEEFADLGAQLVPKSATGRRSAKFRLIVENRGNRSEPVRVETFDPEVKLNFKTRPSVFVAEPGTATFVRLKTMPRKTFFRGPNRTLPFEITAQPEQGDPVHDTGVMLEKQTLPEWLFPVLGIAVLACGLLFALWFTVLRPVVHSAATASDSALSAAAQASNAAGAANQAAKQAAGAKPNTLTTLTVKAASPAVLAGSTDKVTVSGVSANGVSSNPNVVWSSSNPAVATVTQDGTVTAVSPGTATITATTGTSPSATPSPSASVGPASFVGPASLPLTDVADSASATPGGPSVVSGSVTVNVVGKVSVSTDTLPQAVLGKPYSESLNGIGGTGAYTWSVKSGTLPPGFALSPDGTLSGTSNAVGTATFDVQMVNPGPPYQSTEKTFTVSVIDAPAVQTSALPGAIFKSPYRETLKAVFGTQPFSWSLAPGDGVLPDGLALTPDGVISGTPSKLGTFSFTVQVTDSAAQPQSATQQLTIAVTNQLVITTVTQPKLPQDGVRNAPYSLTLAASGGTAPYTWSIPKTSSPLPLGLTLNSTTGVISGTPTVSGSTTFTLQVASAGQAANPTTVSATLVVVDAPVVSTSSLPEAVIGTPYKQQLAAAFGTKGYTWSLEDGQGVLPDGLTLDPATGIISGNATTVGTSAFVVQVTDSTSPKQTATQHLSIAVANALTITTPQTLPVEGVRGVPYSLTLGATGGTAPYTWALTKNSNPLPAGLTLNSATGQISGTPTAATPASGPATFTVQLTDSGVPAQAPLPQTFSLTIVIAPSIATSSLPDATTGADYSQTLAAVNGTPGFTWALVAGQGNLPDGLTLDPATGIISGSAKTTGTFAFTVQATDSSTPKLSATQHLSIAVADALTISTLDMPGAVVNAPYSRTLSASGGAAPYTWSVTSGSLPAGLSLDPNKGVVSGTPTKAGKSTFSVTATDSGNPNRVAPAQQLTLTVVAGLVNTTSSLPQGAVNQNPAYSAQLTAIGGTAIDPAAPYVWTLTGTLPPGLTMTTGGLIAGQPTTPGVYSFSVQVTDGSSPPLNTNVPLSITVVGSLKITTTSLPDVLSGKQYLQTLALSGGAGPYTWSIDKNSEATLPSGLTLNAGTGVISGVVVDPFKPATIMFDVTDSGPPVQTATQTITLAITSPLAFTEPQVPIAVVGQSYTLTPTPSGGSGAGTYRWTETGPLPDGLSLNLTTGVISGKVADTAAPGTYPIQLSLNDTTGGAPQVTNPVTITVNPALNANGPFNWTGTVGTAFSETIKPSGGVAPYSFAFGSTTPAPSWLSIGATSGVVTGTPDVPCPSAPFTADPSGNGGQFVCTPTPVDFSVTIKDSLGYTLTAPVPVVLTVGVPPLVLTNVATIHQTAGAPLTNAQAGTVTGGYGSGATVTYTATNLPCDTNGKCDTISSSGLITGTLANFANPGGSYTVGVTVTQTDPANSANTIVAKYNLTISMP
jgi:hypothetical protein